VDLERALETQRVRLLRLLTGWFAVVALISAGPFAVPLPRWVRAVFADLLVRAEFAAQCLVRVSAHSQAGDRWVVAQGSSSSLAPLDKAERTDEVPSTATLLHRMKALRGVLQDLPRFGRRLLRHTDGDVSDTALGIAPTLERRTLSATPQWIAPGVERPPDRLENNLNVRSRSFQDGRLLAWLRAFTSGLACTRLVGFLSRNTPSHRRFRNDIRAVVDLGLRSRSTDNFA